MVAVLSDMKGFDSVWDAITTGKGDQELADTQHRYEQCCNARIKKRDAMTEAIIDFDIKKAELIADGMRDPKYKTTLKNELAIAKYPDEYRKMVDAVNTKKAYDIFLKKMESRINTIKKLLGENTRNFGSTGR